MFWTDKILRLARRRQHTILSATIVLAVTFGISALLGFLRTRFLYAAFFKCCVLDLDAYNAAFRIPDLIFKLLVTGALSASFIPVFASQLHKNKKEAYQMASSVINLLLIVFTIVSIIVLIFAHPLSQLIAKGFSDYQIDLMSNLSRILLLSEIFFLISNFLTAILQVKQAFIIPSLSPIIYNLFIILSIFTLAPAFGIYGVVYGTVVGAFFHMAIQIPSIKRLGFKYSRLANYKLSGVKEVIHLMLPRTLSLGLAEIESTVTLFFASTLAAGSISLLNLALQLMYLPSRIFGTTVGQASLPILSKNVAKNQLDLFRDTVRKTILQSIFVALPIAVLILVNRVAIVRLAFGTKQFPWSATLTTARTLAFLTPAIFCQAIIQILIRSFYALHDTKTPLRISALSLISNIVTSYYFVTYTNLGIVGLAISASIGNLIQCFGLLWLFIRRIDGHGWSQMLSNFSRIFISSLLSAFVSWLSIRCLDLFILDTSKALNVLLVFIISLSTGVVSYLLFTWLFRSPEFIYIKSYSKRFFRFLS
ncbi:MAG: murein biosynthesis integral membrane protein MurJ [Candidatus Shapirobacteria bacterium]|jgi:putative peptidoglycan lipid II flippase